MSNERLEILKEMRSKVIADRELLDVELAKLDDLIAFYERRAVDNGTRQSRVSPVLVKSHPHSLSSPGIMQKAIAVALEMYDQNPRFIAAGEVLSALERQGLTVGGKSPSGNVSSYLKHTGDLMNFRGHGWVRTRDKERWIRHIEAA